MLLIQNQDCDNIRNTSVIMFHGISQMGGHGTMRLDDFRRQISILANKYQFISLDELCRSSANKTKKLLLTFDDGYHNNFSYAVPILRDFNIPAIFFISHRHCKANSYLWFSYLRAFDDFYQEPIIHWRGFDFDLQGKNRKISMQKIRDILLNLSPHPLVMYKVISQEFPPLESFINPVDISEYYSGMSVEELKTLAGDKLFSLGIHTTDHVFLTHCSLDEARNQIQDNMDFLKQVAANNLCAIAYPSGDYNENIIQLCSELKIPFGFSVSPNNKTWNIQDIPRIGVYSSSIFRTMLKISLSSKLRSFGIKTG